RGAPLASQLRCHLEAILLRQHHVEQDDVVFVHVSQHGRFVTVWRHIHHVALLLETLFDEARDLPVVFHYQNFHGFPAGSSSSRHAPAVVSSTARSSPPSSRASRRDSGSPSP